MVGQALNPVDLLLDRRVILKVGAS
jgi:hypothetical protein